MKTALLVIDAQESFRHRPFFTERDLPAYLAAQNALIAGADRGGKLAHAKAACLEESLQIVHLFTIIFFGR